MDSIRLKNEKDLQFLRISGKILSRTFLLLKKEVKAGVSLKHLDNLAYAFIKDEGATPTFLGYKPDGAGKPYPASLCTSVNDTIVHGIPGNYVLKDGDILSIDLGVTFDGYITDAAITVPVGEISNDARRLINATEKSLQNAIHECFPGNTLGDIGYAIESVAKKAEVSVVEGLTGHGVGFELHEDPSIFNKGKRGNGMKLKAGMVIAIEPMFSLGGPYAIIARDDSFKTKDKSLSAHFEHTIAITEKGYEVLTA
jgi:methionyl aminopeptidase